MTHVRQQIRNKITAMLKEVPAFDGKVFESRVHQVKPDDMPCALVYSGSERIEPATRGNRQQIQKRFVNTNVYVFAKDKESIENALDDLSQVVEEKIGSNPNLDGIVFETNLEETNIHIDGNGNIPMGAAKLSFVSIVQTKLSQPASTFGGQ